MSMFSPNSPVPTAYGPTGAYGASPYGAPYTAPTGPAQGVYGAAAVAPTQDVYNPTNKPPTTYEQPKPKEKGFFARVGEFFKHLLGGGVGMGIGAGLLGLLLFGPVGALIGAGIGLAAGQIIQAMNPPKDRNGRPLATTDSLLGGGLGTGLAGAGIGFMVGGPIGAAIGGAVGVVAHQWNRAFNTPDPDDNLPPRPRPMTPPANPYGAPAAPMATGSYPAPPPPPWLQQAGAAAPTYPAPFQQ